MKLNDKDTALLVALVVITVMILTSCKAPEEIGKHCPEFEQVSVD